MPQELEVVIERMSDSEIRLYRRMSVEHQRLYFNLRQKLDEQVLDFLAMNIRYFTTHGKRHSLGVIRQLSSLLPDSILDSMTSVEVLILLCAAWLHDIGLLVNRDEAGLELSDAEIRERHHELSAWKIREIAPRLDLNVPNLVQLLGNICACHRRSVKIPEQLPQPEHSIHQQRVRTHLLAALLRMADALDTDSQRAPLLLEKISNLSDQSQLHWRTCQMIELDYRPEEGVIHLDAVYQPESKLSEQDVSDLIRYKYNELHDEWKSVQDIFRFAGMPYTQITASLTVPGKSCDRLDETMLPGLEILSLEIIYYRRKRQEYLEEEQQPFFASYWDYQAAYYLEKQAQEYAPDSPEWRRALCRSAEFYQNALTLIESEIQRQPPERYFLRVLEQFYKLKHSHTKDRIKGMKTLSQAEELFLNHLDMVQKALPTAFSLTQLRLGKPWKTFDEEHKIDFTRCILKEAANPEYIGGHHRCCSCVAERALRMSCIQRNTEMHSLLNWLRNRENDQWRTLGNPETHTDIQKTFKYTARALLAFTEAEEFMEASKIANVLASNSDRWLENLEESRYSTLSWILRSLAFYLRRNSSNLSAPAFLHLLEPGNWLWRFFKDLQNMAGQERVEFIDGLVLWREIPEDLVYQDEDGNLLAAREQIKRFVARTIQDEIFKDPLWHMVISKSDTGKWTNRSREKTDALLSFWEYYLQADDLEDFPRLAGITQEQGDVQ